MERVQIKVFGFVQGVLYRSNVLGMAEKLGLTGWVRNAPDGSVELLAEGEKEALEELIDWCQKGPSFAKVEKVQTSWEEATGEFGDFEVRY